MNRMRFFSSIVAGVAGVLATASIGCGGGGSGSKEVFTFNNSASTRTDLGDVTIQPVASQSGLMSRGTTFVAGWPSLSAAPRSFYMSLWRYQEARGDDEIAEYRDDVSASQPNSALAQYSLRLASSELSPGGIYYLELGTTAQTRRYAFIVARDRSVSLPDTTPSRVATITNNVGTGSLSNMTLHWTDDQNGSANISQQTTFTLQFPSDAQAPTNFTVRIGRWVESRGDTGFSYNEQIAKVDHPSDGVWTVKRRDDFDLERGGTYILEVNNSTLTEPLRYAFIVVR